MVIIIKIAVIIAIVVLVAYGLSELRSDKK